MKRLVALHLVGNESGLGLSQRFGRDSFAPRSKREDRAGALRHFGIRGARKLEAGLTQG